MGYSRMNYYDVMSSKGMPTSKYLPAHRLRSSRDVPSSVSPGVLSIHVLAGVQPWDVERELYNQPDGSDHNFNPVESSNNLS